MTYPMRAPCRHCGTTTGRLVARNGQDVVYCTTDGCEAYQYCAPRAETGKPQRSVRTRPTLKPSVRWRILERDGARCAVCGTTDRPLVVDHVCPVEWFQAEGHTVTLADDPENLLTLCEECNSGKADAPLPLGVLLRVLLARIRHRRAPKETI